MPTGPEPVPADDRDRRRVLVPVAGDAPVVHLVVPCTRRSRRLDLADPDGRAEALELLATVAGTDDWARVTADVADLERRWPGAGIAALAATAATGELPGGDDQPVTPARRTTSG
jgi:hypothetical protein